MRAGNIFWTLFLLITGPLVLAACSSKSNSSPGGVDRTSHYRAVCRNMATNCYFMAASKCKGDYDVISKGEVQTTAGTTESYREVTVIYKCK